ncbi:hypothetical protein PHYBLDRAFT_71515 [Phycomyces blakesleeanus NRRL 1555(-)]|uniref:MULE transposase domain-containing protein n=1 Tax=Phycomyces blakesleeanus (strain ATCC 8743b / DSM 1359 / FGSC 10004 / NBRC 33097 / NRRL 1555) TaxID=763407 RepID=A0A162NIV5_PHYB8|nr:hypothetical protein PHYBLDRAFT_71515 [Phycomyces blakesleeanus NRRL 1555(-)]OAD70074.1 hypothetical protein PHYBLDRAFT_71515 [Phycomyces blakesleeanus NRRL 1555(-)]|eukprot:XP_018288114.1 hypothetical protein PHYBLDRAFT_71515 [Phycomyces blakesleeanus NRRL 1555(-)]
MNITINCSIPKVNAIKEALPQAAIHYCDFHVLCAWQHNLNSKIKLNTSFTSEQLGNYKTKWTENKELLRRWGRPYVSQQHQRYVTNNYVESWYNQLKIIYFGRTCIRRLNRLIFILTNDVEFFYEQEVECIHFNNGEMGLTENKLSRKSFAASKIQDDMLSSMILNPLGETGNSMDDYNEIARAELSRQGYTNENEGEVGEIVEERRIVEHRDTHGFDRIATYSTTMYHCFEDLQTLKTIPDLDQTDVEEMKRALAHAVQLMDKYRSKNPSYFRSLNTQR